MATIAPPAQPAAAGPQPGKAKASRLWWHVHQWVGLKLSLFLAFIMLTGTFATVSHEIDWALQPTLRVSPASVVGEPAWDRIGAQVAAYPGIKKILSINEPIASAFAATAMVQWEDESYGFLHLHPTTGQIQGIGPWVGAQRIFRNMHRHLNLPTKFGVPLVSALSILLLISFATSLVVYKKWWRGFTRLPRRRSARAWWGDFHRIAGVWSLWFVLLIGITGLWYLVESLGGDAPRLREAEKIEVTVPRADLAAGLARGLAAVRAADPSLTITSVRFPDDDNARFIFEGQRTAWLVRDRANAITTDARSGEILLINDGSALNVHQRIGEMADPLHFGTFGGYWTKMLWFLFGLLLTSLCVSGVAVYGLRIGRDTAERLVWARHIQTMWLGMGRWRWLSVLCIGLGFALLPLLILGIGQ
jgi:uncharacterized iron-regulated membrane protein